MLCSLHEAIRNRLFTEKTVAKLQIFYRFLIFSYSFFVVFKCFQDSDNTNNEENVNKNIEE